MPDRHRKQDAPRTVQHLISRLVKHEFRIAGHDERQEYLRRAGEWLPRLDWTPLSFALMSNHIHWVFLSGCDPVAKVLHALHVGFARWLNRLQGTCGPVFDGGPGQVLLEEEHCQRLVAYVHNNPVRARVVGHPEDTDWTSHRYYLGLEPAPRWLDVERGLHLGGFDASTDGRRAFGERVLDRLGEGRDDAMSGRSVRPAREESRRVAGAPLEVTTARIVGAEPAPSPRHELLIRGATVLRPRWPGTAQRAVAAVCARLGIALEEVQSRRRITTVVAARRVALRLWTRWLWRPQTEIIGWIGIGAPAASRLACRARPGDDDLAQPLARMLWDEVLAKDGNGDLVEP